MAGMIDQSVPRPQAPGTPPGMDPAMLEYLMGEDQEEAMRQQAMVDQLRGYGGGAMPQTRGKYAPVPLEYGATLANRLVSMTGDKNVREAGGSALKSLYERLYGGGGGTPTGPADPSFAGVGSSPY